MRVLVVVPIDTFWYVPSARFFTPGAVCRHTEPLRFGGGAMPSSKMRICVASRMPNTVPFTRTVSSSLSLRTSASLSGGSRRCSAILGPGHRAVSSDDDCSPLAAPALDVDGHRVLADVRVRPLDVDRHGGGAAAQPLRANARVVDLRQKVLLERCHVGIGVAAADA